MHVPTTSAVTNLGPVSSVNVAVHEITGVSWHVLMPYTLLGGGLMIYSQARLMRGQRVMKMQSAPKANKSTMKARNTFRWLTFRRTPGSTLAATNY